MTQIYHVKFGTDKDAEIALKAIDQLHLTDIQAHISYGFGTSPAILVIEVPEGYDVHSLGEYEFELVEENSSEAV